MYALVAFLRAFWRVIHDVTSYCRCQFESLFCLVATRFESSEDASVAV